MRERIDRFIEDALIAFADWYVASDWRGKEHDCVNLFAHRFLARGIQDGAAIHDLAQIRIEGGVAQPSGFSKPSARKDLVIWQDPLATAWDEGWRPVNLPRAVMEWKSTRKGRPFSDFHDHDATWLKAFTKENPDALGYLVAVCIRPNCRTVDWAKVARGTVQHRNRRS